MHTSHATAACLGLAMAGLVALGGCASSDVERATGPETSVSSAAATSPHSPVSEADLHTYVGSPGAPRTVTVYEDFLCPWCKEYHDVSTQALAPLVEQGRVRVDYRPFNHLARLGSYSGDATAVFAALRAVDRQAAVDFHDWLYDHQPSEEGPAPTLAELEGDAAVILSARTGVTREQAASTIGRYVAGSYVRDWVGQATSTAYDHDHVEYTPWVTVTAADGTPINVEFGDDDTTEQFVQRIVEVAAV